MCRNATLRAASLLLLASGVASAQGSEWRRVGTAALDLGFPSAAGGPVSRVWYSPEGNTLFAQLARGGVWQTRDFETWAPAQQNPPAASASVQPAAVPERTLRIERAAGTRRYGLGRFVYRSDDGGDSWTNLSGYRGQSILGEGLLDMALSPADPDQVVVANWFGIWRSLDGGATWAGLNEGLPNLPARRILSVPRELEPARLLVSPNEATVFSVAWAPGERLAWRPVEATLPEDTLRARLARTLGIAPVRALASGNWIYGGAADGRLFVSPDNGQSWIWHNAPLESGAVSAIAANGPMAVAVLEERGGYRAPRVLRTVNGGRLWDDITANLPPGSVHGVAADWASGFLYAATARGLFATSTDLANLTLAGEWSPIGAGLPAGRVVDVRLDAAGNQLYALVDGYGLYAAMAPHRALALRVVNAADFSSRSAAPGSLLSILGGRVERVSAGPLNVPVLASSDLETQIQVPFEAEGDPLALTLFRGGRFELTRVPLAPLSPAIFIDRDGAPLLLDADSGTALDAMNPARSGTRLQILATGLGAVRPAWPSGTPAPAGNPPAVVAPVRVFLDRAPVEVTRATLAPGYIGFYLIEVQLPAIVNHGPAELSVEAGGSESNRVRLYLAP